MKFVALLSGGKDSCYNILHCMKNGHSLAAIANLYPAGLEQELDSFMFQTVGFDILSEFTRCIGNIPLFRRPIYANTSKNLDLNYVETSKDEIEELYELLKEIKEKIPDLEAVSVGAILSSYQRTRVESVCDRLNLVVLSYLWQRSQHDLMSEMCLMSKSNKEETDNTCGNLDARIIKVAALGLDKTDLGKSLPEIFPKMLRLNKMYEVNICGEGGEFETIVLDAPFFDRGYLKLEEVIYDDIPPREAGSDVFSARFKVSFHERSLPPGYLESQLDILPTPKLLPSPWLDIYSAADSQAVHADLGMDDFTFAGEHTYTRSVFRQGNLLFIFNLRASNPLTESSVEGQFQDILSQLQEILEENKVSPSNAFHSSLILSDMAHFATINKLYKEFFSVSKWGPLPPTRTCVASSLLGPNTLVQLSLVADTSCQMKFVEQPYTQENVSINMDKKGLHVQGRSYWAPCNIGPYSQVIWNAKCSNQTSYFSGQIALNPASMDITGLTDPKMQAVLSLKHFNTLKQTVNSNQQLSMTCFISSSDIVSLVADVWCRYCSVSFQEELEANTDDFQKCLIIVKVSQLPKGAHCEWGGMACQKLNTYEEFSDDEPSIRDTTVMPLETSSVLHKVLVSSQDGSKCYATFFADSENSLIDFVNQLPQTASLTLYFNPTAVCSRESGVFELGNSVIPVEYVPVESVYDYKGYQHLFGAHLQVLL